MSPARRSKNRALALASAAGIAIAAGTSAAAAQAQGPTPQDAAIFDNGSQITTTDGTLMHAHGGGILEVDDTYYMVGENRVDDGFLFNAVSMYSSTDLVNWTHANDILTRNSDPDLDPANIERPKVVYNAEHDHYVMWAHKENGSDYIDAEVAVAVSDTVDGDYVYQGAFRPLGHESRDQTVYVDDDGTGYLISAARSNYDLHIYRLTDDFLGIDELVHVFEGDHREAPAVFERDGVHFLVTSGASGWNANQQQYATTENFPEGPWSDWQNVGDSTTFGSQTTYVAEISGSAGTDYMHMGDRWGPQWGGTPNDSQYVWLPLEFPTPTSVTMDWYAQLSIDTAAGTVEGLPGGDDGSPWGTTFVNEGSGRCLDVPGGTADNGTVLHQWGCWGGEPQAFSFDPVYPGSEVGSIANTATGKCVDVFDQSTEVGAPVGQWGCWNGSNQRFKLDPVGDVYQVVAMHSGLCLQIEGPLYADGVAIVQGECDGAPHQLWSIPGKP
ncbi:RICIN domain-containing protein [Glycomyces sp. L485]|uniref:RICIN domain-containing protein n=1 Tax=Glycomyces sp. L485 TaxID=2909235 RepID=UPI001F4A244B|nr:RICIN domain-containing protein [Glycomyces sp. L485]MCH7233109.1 RICIN domain-containing protein [Glycomyces sp. L485]